MVKSSVAVDKLLNLVLIAKIIWKEYVTWLNANIVEKPLRLVITAVSLCGQPTASSSPIFSAYQFSRMEKWYAKYCAQDVFGLSQKQSNSFFSIISTQKTTVWTVFFVLNVWTSQGAYSCSDTLRIVKDVWRWNETTRSSLRTWWQCFCSYSTIHLDEGRRWGIYQ